MNHGSRTSVPFPRPILQFRGGLWYCCSADFFRLRNPAQDSRSTGGGLPVVATEKAAEGLSLTHGTDILFAHNTDQFIARIGELFDHPQLTEGLRRQAANTVTKFSWQTIVREFAQSVQPLPNRLELVANGNTASIVV